MSAFLKSYLGGANIYQVWETLQLRNILKHESNVFFWDQLWYDHRLLLPPPYSYNWKLQSLIL